MVKMTNSRLFISVYRELWNRFLKQDCPCVRAHWASVPNSAILLLSTSRYEMIYISLFLKLHDRFCKLIHLFYLVVLWGQFSLNVWISFSIRSDVWAFSVAEWGHRIDFGICMNDKEISCQVQFFKNNFYLRLTMTKFIVIEYEAQTSYAVHDHARCDHKAGCPYCTTHFFFYICVEGFLSTDDIQLPTTKFKSCILYFNRRNNT